MAPKTHHELKMDALKKKNSKTITDSDYVMRDIEKEIAEGDTRNMIDITPEAFRVKKAPAARTKAEE